MATPPAKAGLAVNAQLSAMGDMVFFKKDLKNSTYVHGRHGQHGFFRNNRKKFRSIREIRVHKTAGSLLEKTIMGDERVAPSSYGRLLKLFNTFM